MKEYKIIIGTLSGYGQNSLEKRVMEKIKYGWVPLGSPFLIYKNTEIFGQAMTKESDEDNHS